MYFDPYYFQHGNMDHRQPQYLRDIEKAVNDEFEAVQYYTRLAELAPNQQLRQSILGIRQDEIRHFHQFSQAYHSLSGRYPPITLRVQLPVSFAAGVRDSIKDEQETVPFYHQLASQVPNEQIRRRIYRAAEDEQRHAQIFSQIASSL